jgi:hypothetical protein
MRYRSRTHERRAVDSAALQEIGQNRESVPVRSPGVCSGYVDPVRERLPSRSGWAGEGRERNTARMTLAKV